MYVGSYPPADNAHPFLSRGAPTAKVKNRAGSCMCHHPFTADNVGRPLFPERHCIGSYFFVDDVYRVVLLFRQCPFLLLVEGVCRLLFPDPLCVSAVLSLGSVGRNGPGEGCPIYPIFPNQESSSLYM